MKNMQIDINRILDKEQKITYNEFCIASNEFHIEYFKMRLDEIGDLDNIENVCMLILAMFECPFQSMKLVFDKLNTEYQIIFRIVFVDTSRFRLSMYKNLFFYKSNDIDLKMNKIISYFNNIGTLTEIVFIYKLIYKLENFFWTSSVMKEGLGGYHQLSYNERKELISELITRHKNIDNKDIISFFNRLITASTSTNKVQICKLLIPKFINNDSVDSKAIIEILDKSKLNVNVKWELLSHFIDTSTPFDRVMNWVNDYTDSVEYYEVIENLNKFPNDLQFKLFKKLFTLPLVVILKNEFIEKLYLLEHDKKLNLEIQICIAVLISLSKSKSYIGDNVISEIVCNYVNNNVDTLLQIKDLFQYCKGRSIPNEIGYYKKQWYLTILGKDFPKSENQVIINNNKYVFNNETRIVSIEGKEYIFNWKEKNDYSPDQILERPNGQSFCDAIKSQLDTKYNRHFYWCCNTKCYSPCQEDQNLLVWDKYTLRDFIKILNLPFEEDKYYRFVSIVNRANRLMQKLQCISCNKILRDVETSEFAFYRVNSFHCTNDSCSLYHKRVYLNHCNNWKCSNIIDSRISDKCTNDWYKCDLCNYCCTQEKLEKRLADLIENNSFNPSKERHRMLKYQVENRLGHY